MICSSCSSQGIEVYFHRSGDCGIANQQKLTLEHLHFYCLKCYKDWIVTKAQLIKKAVNFTKEELEQLEILCKLRGKSRHKVIGELILNTKPRSTKC